MLNVHITSYAVLIHLRFNKSKKKRRQFAVFIKLINTYKTRLLTSNKMFNLC